MKPIIKFDEFIRKGVVKEQTPNKSRAIFLIKEADQNYKYLLELVEKMGITDINANDYLKKCYDIIMEITRAKMLIKGYNASGFGAHEAEVAYLREIGTTETEVQFVNQLRFFRNGMLYYGTILDKEYAEKVIRFTKKIYAELMKELVEVLGDFDKIMEKD